MVLPPKDPMEGEVAVPSGQIFATMEGWAAAILN
jgi:hypothetical protein